MANDSCLHFGPYRLDVDNEQLWRGAQLVRLTPKAFQVLRTLADSPGQLVTKEELFRVVWPETVVSDAALTSCIQELRQALGDNARTPQYIETAHRRGFRFIAEVQSPRSKVQSQEEKQTAEGNQPEQETEAEKVSPPDAESPLQSSVLSPLIRHSLAHNPQRPPASGQRRAW